MKILDKYILKSYLTRFIGVFAICFLIFIIQTFWLYIDELAGKGLDIFTIGKFFMYFSPKLVPLVLPLSILLASLTTYGTLSENYEFIAMKSNGISIVRSMVALLIFHIFLGIGSFYFSDNVVTYGELKSYNLRKNLAKLKPTLSIREGIFNDIGNMNIKVAKKFGDNEQFLEDIILHSISDDEVNRLVIKAENGEVKNENENYLQLILRNGYRYEDILASTTAEKQKYPHTRASFDEYILNIDISEFNNVNLEEENYKSTYRMQKVTELKKSSDTLINKFESDKNRHGITFLSGHTIRKLPNLNTNQAELIKVELNKSFLYLLDNPEVYETNSILTMADEEVDMYLRQLSNKKKTFFLQEKLINLHKLSINERYSLIFACIFLFLIGASLGAIIRKGGLGLPLVLSIVIFLTYHYIGVFGKNAAEDSSISPFIGSWISTFIIAPFAIYLTKIVSADRGISFTLYDKVIQVINKFKLGK
ncbi:MAG: YjgP/YjgQ family permease [Cryomorphaceae bacterium]|nr:YjgP/YjgQ family permease [Cryomorphaceae bacterium]MBT3503644.1 YjgP/YjgQ family permease [Cryomorphaceae bacterium]MBT4293661.1 YjgP/YjgQ family permease [Cryomorphaceae bacterium]MBT4517164.1 YjgP/YjgQ family permease [Cryomorphaceae bacterium]MBT4834582.1 YjgP/YjgQ family permease [Cryomorphaceae bacterium]